MRYASLTRFGRISVWMADRFAPAYKSRRYLATFHPGSFYISSKAVIEHDELYPGEHVFIDDLVIIYKAQDGGAVTLDANVQVNRETIMQTGAGGLVEVGRDTSIQPRCIFSAYVGAIRVGQNVQIAPYCTFYSYNHAFAPGQRIIDQPLQSKGGITIGDDAWLGVGVTVLDGVHIGSGAVVGAGSVVTRDIPDQAIAAGNPAKIVKHRREIETTVTQQEENFHLLDTTVNSSRRQE